MRIGLISDIHGNSPALNAILDELARKQTQRILFAGDAIGYYPYVNEVVEKLRSIDCISVRGNHESYLFHELPISDERRRAYKLDYTEQMISKGNREWLKGLQKVRILEIDGTRILLCHGSPWAIDEYIYPNNNQFNRFANLDFDFVVMGHTHIPMIKVIGKVVLINPGSCGQPRDYIPGACYCIIDTDSKQVNLYRSNYDLESFLHLLRGLEYPQHLMGILCRTKSEKGLET